MTPEEIRKQMMGSAGLKEENADSLFEKADALYKNKDYSQAFALAKRAADQGHMAACHPVGVCYANGLGVEENLPLAREMFERSANAGLPCGLRNFAVTKIREEFGPPDYASATVLLNKAIEAGDIKAPAILAQLYREGKGVEKDTEKYLQLLQRGVDLGDEIAMGIYADCLAKGENVPKDPKQALSLAKEAHEKGYEPAENLVAEIEAEMQGKPLSRSDAAPPNPATNPSSKSPRNKSMAIAVVLAFFLGPFGLLYVSWKRALVMLLVFIIGVSLIPKNGFVVLLLWLVVPILSIIALGVGKRQPPPA